MIELIDLSKSYQHKMVLKQLNYEFKKGLVTAFLGPNASGKSTSIKSILGLVKPNSGKIAFHEIITKNGKDPKEKIGYMPQHPYFPENLSIHEILTLMKSLRNDQTEYDYELYEAFNLAEFESKKVTELSGGTVQKLSAVIAFLFHPQIIILDEPTAGLDPKSAWILKNKIRKSRSENKTIIISTHIVNEINELADEILYILNGSIQFTGSLYAIKSLYPTLPLDEIIVKLAEKNDS